MFIETPALDDCLKLRRSGMPSADRRQPERAAPYGALLFSCSGNYRHATPTELRTSRAPLSAKGFEKSLQSLDIFVSFVSFCAQSNRDSVSYPSQPD